MVRATAFHHVTASDARSFDDVGKCVKSDFWEDLRSRGFRVSHLTYLGTSKDHSCCTYLLGSALIDDYDLSHSALTSTSRVIQSDDSHNVAS